ncbi:hypothetical protein DITRI_Ditri10aG0026000 [Diplodiscus trichospermus]
MMNKRDSKAIYAFLPAHQRLFLVPHKQLFAPEGFGRKNAWPIGSCYLIGGLCISRRFYNVCCSSSWALLAIALACIWRCFAIFLLNYTG